MLILFPADNHKAWQSFEVFLHGTTMELLRLYIEDTLDSPTATGFFLWQSRIEGPTLPFLFDLTLNFGLSIYVQRVGDRNNDARCSNAGRMRFLDMFFVLFHPIYREAEYHVCRTNSIMPIVIFVYFLRITRILYISFSESSS